MTAERGPADLPHLLARSVLVRARRSTVFGFFTDSVRFAAWWGPGSTVDPRPGGFSARGTNYFRFAPDGRIAAVVGFWAPSGSG